MLIPKVVWALAYPQVSNQSAKLSWKRCKHAVYAPSHKSRKRGFGGTSPKLSLLSFFA